MLSLIHEQNKLDEMEQSISQIDSTYIKAMSPIELSMAIGRFNDHKDVLFQIDEDLGKDIDKETKARIKKYDRQFDKIIKEIEAYAKEIDGLTRKVSANVDAMYARNPGDTESYNAGISNVIQLHKAKLSALDSKYKIQNGMISNAMNERKVTLSEKKANIGDGANGAIDVTNKSGIGGNFAVGMLGAKGRIKRDGRHMGVREKREIQKEFDKTPHEFALEEEPKPIKAITDENVMEEEFIIGEEPEVSDPHVQENIAYLGVEDKCDKAYHIDPVRGIGWVVATNRETGETYNIHDTVALYKDSVVNWNNKTISDANGSSFDIVETDISQMPQIIRDDWKKFIDGSINEKGAKPIAGL